MPFLLSSPSEHFGAWLKRQAGDDTAAGEIAGSYGADIGDEATPADVRDVLLAQGASPLDRDTFMEAVRDWLAASIPLDFEDRNENDNRLIAWPFLVPGVIDGPPLESATCTICGETRQGPFRFGVAGIDGGFVCSDCARAVPGGSGCWAVAEGLYTARGEGG